MRDVGDEILLHFVKSRQLIRSFVQRRRKIYGFRAVLDKKNPGTLSIKGNDNEVINVYLLEGTLYKTIAVKKGEIKKVRLPSGYYEISRAGGPSYWMIVCPKGKTILE